MFLRLSFLSVIQTCISRNGNTLKLLWNLPTQLAHIFISVSGYSIIFTKMKLSAVKTQWKSWCNKLYFRDVSTHFSKWNHILRHSEGYMYKRKQPEILATFKVPKYRKECCLLPAACSSWSYWEWVHNYTSPLKFYGITKQVIYNFYSQGLQNIS